LYEGFIYVYYAGHGCMDHKQYFVLNAKEIKKMFYPIEERMKRLLT
jgi:hypothetical protein